MNYTTLKFKFQPSYFESIITHSIFSSLKLMGYYSQLKQSILCLTQNINRLKIIIKMEFYSEHLPV